MRSPLARARHARGAPDQDVTAGSPGERNDDALTCLPRALDAVVLEVLLEILLDAVGDPEQRDLAERRQVPRPEVVGERGVDALGRVDVAVCHPAPDRFGCHVDQLDLLGLPDDRVRDRLLLLDARDAFNDVVDRFEVLDVQRGDDVDARREQLLGVLPALLVARPGQVGVGELVDEDDFGPARQDRVDVHLLESAAAVLDRLARDHLEIADLCLGARPAVRLVEADHDVGPALVPPPALVEHGVGLPDAGSSPQVDPELAAGHAGQAPGGARGVTTSARPARGSDRAR